MSYHMQVPEFLDNIKTKKFVLIHGEGFGAWCWYKIVALLEEAGLLPVALDLTGSGIDLTDTHSVTTLAEYSKPLIDYLQNLPEDEKVVLVGHSFGGACISYALEHYSEKISKAIFLCATMVTDGQRPFDVFDEMHPKRKISKIMCSLLFTFFSPSLLCGFSTFLIERLLFAPVPITTVLAVLLVGWRL
ncbi:hypothetical protein RIF29_02015 [Crotalaria pallida]|uniref:AB hydrolase-1 domain-containing protein n=1 Tax=Crotalaria pallida TaxID=3830 RepID=A0AAN9IYQ0_CROPI